MRAWLRANRWALLTLPLVVAVAGVLSAGRLLQFWLPEQQHDAVRGVEQVHFTEEYYDVESTRERSIDLRLLDVSSVTDVERDGEALEVSLPAATELWAIDLQVTADPEEVLLDCVVALRDDEGRSHTSDATRTLLGADGWASIEQAEWCVPIDAPGPAPALGIGEADTYTGEPRPESFEIRSYVLTPEGVSPEAVRVWWGRGVPSFAEITWD